MQSSTPRGYRQWCRSTAQTCEHDGWGVAAGRRGPLPRGRRAPDRGAAGEPVRAPDAHPVSRSPSSGPRRRWTRSITCEPWLGVAQRSACASGDRRGYPVAGDFDEPRHLARREPGPTHRWSGPHPDLPLPVPAVAPTRRRDRGGCDPRRRDQRRSCSTPGPAAGEGSASASVCAAADAPFARCGRTDASRVRSTKPARTVGARFYRAVRATKGERDDQACRG